MEVGIGTMTITPHGGQPLVPKAEGFLPTLRVSIGAGCISLLRAICPQLPSWSDHQC